jgi:NAD(P)-dependent dehydrogenase (short-subunit alcohol dehydrogenase family)
LKLAGQVAVVTGAGRGIGRAIAGALSREGAAVVLAARSSSELDGVRREIEQAGGRALAVPTDVRQEASVEALVRRPR